MLVSWGEVAGAGNLSLELLGLRRKRGAPDCGCCAPSELVLHCSIGNRAEVSLTVCLRVAVQLHA